MTEFDLLPLLQSIAASLERLAPKQGAAPDLWAADAFVWHSQGEWLEPIHSVNRVDIDLLRGIDRARDILIDNTRDLRRDCRPTTRCCGARAAPARVRWSRRSMRLSTARPAARRIGSSP